MTSDGTKPASNELENAPPHSMLPGAGRYELGDKLGAGAMGVVYRAYDPELDRAVAIKLVRVGGAAGEARLVREAQAMARLHHPNVVAIFDVGLASGAVFIVMALLEGGTLRGWLQGGTRPLDAILERFAAAGRGLAAAHAVGLVHRDFKPDNVLLNASGEVFVADFGLARLANRKAARPGADLLRTGVLSQTGDVVGTPPYMSPEQLRGGPVDARADQFSFCVALWEAIYGERPFSRPIAGNADPRRARLDAIAAGPGVPVRRDRPAWLAELLRRGLAADPDHRWPAMQALLDVIAAHRAPRWRPWRLAAAMCVGLGISAPFALLPHVSESMPRYHLASLLQRSDLKSAAISPDGTQLAIVSGDALVIRGTGPDSPGRVVIAHGIVALPPSAWSPDGGHLVVGVQPETVGQSQIALIDLDAGTQRKLPFTGTAAFLSNAEIAVTSPRWRSVAIVPVERAATSAVCNVDGDYTLLRQLAGLPDGTMIVETVKGEAHALVMMRPDCRVRARYSADGISSFAVSDAGTIIALVSGQGFRDLVEITPDGELMSRRRISGDIDTVLGRHRSVDYVASRVLNTHLDRVHDGRPGQHVLSVNGRASFNLSPDGDTLTWVEHAGAPRERGPLWRASVRDALQTRQLLCDNAVMASWSPDGRALAVLVDDGDALAVIVIDRAGTQRRRLPLQHLARDAAPVWWDDHRILAQSDDYLAYQLFDLTGGEPRNAMDTSHGGTYWLARSPRDGMLAMWRNGPPGATDARTDHLWLQPLGGAARPLHTGEALRHYMAPSWSPSGELFVRAFETGVVSRVALGTGELTTVAQLPRMPPRLPYTNHLMFLPDGDMLAVDVEIGMDLAKTVSDDAMKAPLPVDPGSSPL